MVNHGGVNARVAFVDFDDAGELKFYQEHESNGQHYIRVVTGDRFIVMIDITPEFDFMGQPDVQIHCMIDGEEDAIWFMSASEMSRLGSRDLMRRINYFDTERVIKREWMNCALSFGELEIDDNIVQTQNADLRDSRWLGSIRVEITRGQSLPWGPQKMFPRECGKDIRVASRAVVETYHITHTLKTLPLAERNQPWVHWEFVPAGGLPGRPQKSTILYRSQEALELLQVVPKTKVGVKKQREGREDLTTKRQAPIRPDLDHEADIKTGDVTVSSKAQYEQEGGAQGNVAAQAAQHPPVHAQAVAVPGNKRKRNDATSESTSDHKKVKFEESSVRSELTSSIQTRSKTRAKARLAAQREPEVVETAVVDKGVQVDGGVQEDTHKGDGGAGWLFGRLSSVWASLSQGRAAYGKILLYE